MTMGALLEEKFGAPWEELITRDLVTPLGIESAGFGAPLGDAPLGHHAKIGAKWMRLIGPEPKPRANDGSVAADNPPILGPAGTLHMNVNDLARGFGRAVLNGYQGRPSPISQASCRRMMTPQLQMGQNLQYGLGWMIVNLPDTPQILYHTGSNTMWFALLALVPDHDLVIAYASNDGRGLAKRERELLSFIKGMLAD